MGNKVIRESIMTSDSINRLSADEERFFYRLLLTSDDHGRFEADCRVLIARCFPLKIGEVTLQEVNALLEGLEAAGIVRTYTANGKRYGLFETWEKHNKLRNQKSKHPGPDDCDAVQPSPVANDCQQLKTIENNCEQLIPSRARHDSDSDSDYEVEERGKGSAEGKPIESKTQGPKPPRRPKKPSSASPSLGEGIESKIRAVTAKVVPEPTAAELAATEERRKQLRAQYEAATGAGQ